MQSLLDTNAGIFGLGAASEEATQAIRDYPNLKARVDRLIADQVAMAQAVSAYEAEFVQNAPASVRARLGELTKATVEAATNLSELRQRIREGVQAAKANGTITADELATLEPLGLAGLGSLSRVIDQRASAASRVAFANAAPLAFRSQMRSSWASAGNPGVGIEGLGFLPSIVGRAAASSAARSFAYASEGRATRQMRGLGLIPVVVVIGYALAGAIAAAIVGGTLVVAWRATSESAARAEAVRDQAAASLAAWKASVSPPGSPPGSSTPRSPLPPLPPIPGEPGGILATAGRALPFVALAALGLVAFKLFRK